LFFSWLQGGLKWEGKRAVLRVPGIRGAHLHAALDAFNSGRMCVFCVFLQGPKAVFS